MKQKQSSNDPKVFTPHSIPGSFLLPREIKKDFSQIYCHSSQRQLTLHATIDGGQNCLEVDFAGHVLSKSYVPIAHTVKLKPDFGH